MTGPATITTDRLLLRPFTHDDLEQLTELFAEPSFWWFPFRGGRSVDDAAAFLDRVVPAARHERLCEWAAEDRATGRLAGYVGLSVPDFLPEILPAVEIGWRLGEAFRGRGYATEAGAAWLEYGFSTLGLDRIVSVHEPDNVSSGAVMQRLGMAFERATTLPASGLPVHVHEISVQTWRSRIAHDSD